MLGNPKAHALIVDPDHFIDSSREQLVPLAAHHAIPAICGLRELGAADDLMTYGVSLSGVYRQLRVRRIDPQRRGSGELPVQRPTKFELVLRTAQALGLNVPLALQAADEAIE